jgi:phenylacetate-CoA ligase
MHASPTIAREVSSAEQGFVVSALQCDGHPADGGCHYQVAWSINPHMKIGGADFHRATAQHGAFKTELRGLGAQVVELPFVHGAFDCVFAKDAALLVEQDGTRRALLARFRHRERRAEADARAESYRQQGFEVVDDEARPTWEGGDVVGLPRGAGLLFGYGQRSSLEAASWLHRMTGEPVTPLELCDPSLYHLDMALAILPDGTALVSEGAFTAEALRRLEHARGITSVIPIPHREALAFGLNLVVVGDTLIGSTRSPRIDAICGSRGFRFRVTPLDQFQMAGGGAACLVAPIYRTTAKAKRLPRVRPKPAMDPYGPFFRSVLLPAWERGVRRRPVLDLFKKAQKTQWASSDELHAIQGAALQRLIRHAYAHVPFYRALMDKAGVGPDDVRTPEDLPLLPVVRRAALQSKNEERRSTAPPWATIRKHTSGTTGEPLVFGYEPESEHWRQAMKLRGYEWAGYHLGDRALYFWGAPAPTPPPPVTRAKIAVDRWLKRETYRDCASLDDSRLAFIVREIERIRPSVIVCYAQAGAELARYVIRNGLRSWETIPVICGAEQLLPGDRADLVEAFGPSVFETYGCREVMLIAAECESHAGMHVTMENLVVEILVRDGPGMRPAREGEMGEVVVTDLHNLGMPFIRYANGDLGTAGPESRCACGRSLTRLAAAQGRTSELLRTVSGTPVSGLALSFLMQDLSSALRQFQCVQHRDGSLTINLLLAEHVPQTALDAIARNAERLLQGARVTVREVSELPRGVAGKHQLVVVERDS